MNVCVIGDFTGNPDEGMKKVAFSLRECLSLENKLFHIGLRQFLNPIKLLQLIKFNPEILHYVHGPTLKSLFLLKFIKTFFFINCKVVSTATRPDINKKYFWILPKIKPDLILTQSEKHEELFIKNNVNVKFFPNGVDCKIFDSVSNVAKLNLKIKHNIPLDKKIILHVGHIKENRQLDLFVDIQKIKEYQVVIVGSTNQKLNNELYRKLKSCGIIIIHQFIEKVNEIYSLADLYVFHLLEKESTKLSNNKNGAIDIPLSVLEAMACNLPVISTRFGALERILSSGDGFSFVNSKSELIKSIRELNWNDPINTRKKIVKYDWHEVAKKLIDEYKKLSNSVI